jgi:hypothetical protein
MDDGTQWVKVEFCARLPDRQVMMGLDPATVGATLMRAFGFTYIDGLTVYVAKTPGAPGATGSNGRAHAGTGGGGGRGGSTAGAGGAGVSGTTVRTAPHSWPVAGPGGAGSPWAQAAGHDHGAAEPCPLSCPGHESAPDGRHYRPRWRPPG